MAIHRLILTYENDYTFSVVILGEHDLQQDPDGDRAKRFNRTIQNIIVHEGYDKGFQGGASPHDIALIRVNEMIPLYNENDPKISNVIPVCLPWNINDPGRQITVEDKLIGLGWGKVTNNNVLHLKRFLRNRAGAGILQQLKVPGISKRVCQAYDAFKNIELDLRFQLCAGGEEGLWIKFIISTFASPNE